MLRQLLLTIESRAKLLTLCAMCTGSLTAHADWQLINADSQLSFVSIKATHIAERHSFSRLSGRIEESGRAHLTVDLGSVNTGIEIRDQRMRDLLFNITEIPKAKFTTDLNINTASALQAGEQKNLLVQGKLSVHKLSVDIETELSVVRLAENRVIVSTKTPMLLSASSLGLAEGVEQLRAIANLPDISLAVPVTFQLLFEKTP